MKKSLIVTFLILLLALAGLAALVALYKPSQVEKKKVAASIFPVYDIARNIIGDKMDVELILPPGVSPHTFEPSPKEAAKIQNAQIIFIIGHGLDIWAENLAKANAPQAIIITLDKNINLRQLGGEPNPHYFVSLKNGAIIAQTIADEISGIDPANRIFYQSQAQSYIAKLNNLLSEGRVKLASLKDKNFITFHEAFGYFASDFGLSVAATIEPFPGKEPSAQYLEDVSKIIDQYRVKALFKEPQLSSAVIEALARDKGIKLLTLDPLGGNTGSFYDMMKSNINTVFEGLK
jgi:zinc transport system substrate-binding protein